MAESDLVLQARRVLVEANRILADQQVLDAYGHISIRHPLHADRYLITRSRSPELVEDGDLIELDFLGREVTSTGWDPVGERFIHGGIFEARPDVNAVVHHHATWFLPFTISGTPLEALLATASIVRGPLPIWDIAQEFGDATDLLVTTVDQGRSLARTLGDGDGVLLRAHGSAIVGPDMKWAAARSIELLRNARARLDAEGLGPLIELSAAERAASFESSRLRGFDRHWEHWCHRAGLPVDGSGRDRANA